MTMYKLTNFSLSSIVIILFLLSGQTLAQEDLPKLVKKIQPAIVTIFTYDIRGKEKSIGTGFFINSEGHFLTNYHVLKDAIRVELKTHEGLSYTMKRVISQDKIGDLAIGEVKSPVNISYLKFCNAPAEIGQRIIVIGSPMGLEQTLSDGLVSAIRHIPNLGNILQITAPISPGSSGSPVVNMESEVIGVATFLFKEGQNLNFAIPSSRALELLTSSEVKKAKINDYKKKLPDESVPSLEQMPKASNGKEDKYLIDYLGNKIEYHISIVGKINCAGFMNGYYIETPLFKNRRNLPGIMIVNYDDELLEILWKSGRICRFDGLANKEKSVIFINSIDKMKYIGKLKPHLLQDNKTNGMEITLTGTIYMSAVMGYAMNADNGINVSFGEELPVILENILRQGNETRRNVTLIGELFPKKGIRGSNFLHVLRIGFEGDPLIEVPRYYNK